MSESDRYKLLKLRGIETEEIEASKLLSWSDIPAPKRPMTEAEEKLIEWVVERNQTREYWDKNDKFDQLTKAVLLERTSQADVEEMKRLGEAYEKAYEAYRAAKKRVPPMCR